MSSYTDIESIVQEIQQQIRQKQYAKALASVESLEKISDNRDLIYWYKALLYTKIGRLHIAIQYLDCIEGEFQPTAEILIEEIERNWTAYAILVGEYNAAVTEIRNGHSESALYMLNDALHRAGKIPVPIEVYRMKMLLLARHRPDLLARSVLDLPVHALSDSIVKCALAAENEEPTELEMLLPPATKPAKKRILSVKKSNSASDPSVAPMKKRKINLSVALLYVVIIGSFSLSIYLLFGSEDSTNPTTNPPIDSPNEVVGEVFGPEVPEDLEPPSLADDEKPMLIPVALAEDYYTTGFSAYSSGDYKEAITYFEQAVRSLESEYFSDDAAYYLVVSYMRESAYEKALKAVQQFLKEESEHYLESPYRSAIRLQESNALLKLNRREESIAVLEELSNKPEVDWVNHEAASKLKVIMGL